IGNSQISTVQSKFGGSAMYFDGVDDNAIIPYNPIFSLGTADFTVEGWFYFSNISTTRRGIVALGDGANGGGPYSAWSLTYLGSEASNQIALSLYDGTSYDYATSGFTISANTWYHIAVARYSGVLKIFVNGISYYSNTVTTNFNAVNTNPLRIGLQYYGPAGGYGGPRYWNGYINDLRITKGYARYTANFTPPTSAFPTQ
ncbi:MAG: LamG domain-containing protein, partial [Bacteroidota bacterium]